MEIRPISSDSLRKKLKRLDGKSYRTYRSITGRYRFEGFIMNIPGVQADPFAPPTPIEVVVKHSDAGFPPEFYSSSVRRLAMEDFLLRILKNRIHRFSGGIRGTGKSGLISAHSTGQEVLKRDAVTVDESSIRAIIFVGLPGRGRLVDGSLAVKVLIHEVPQIVKHTFFAENVPIKQMEKHIRVVEDQEFIRRKLTERKLVAFVADGSVLPRRSGVDERPIVNLEDGLLENPITTEDGITVVPFRSPESMQVVMEVPNAGRITGMGIPEGVTVITGGGFHGKSTLLSALVRCVYPHIPGDGREYVVTRSDGVFVRAEDGRSVQKVDISNFITGLPFGAETDEFTTSNASGSTSQAAGIMEYLEAGSRLLFIDEDTSATNFMVRDRVMQEVVQKENEPITPYIDRVREMYEKFGISTVLVTGGIGDFIGVADKVILMKEYVPYDITEVAKSTFKRIWKRRLPEVTSPFRLPEGRAVDPESFNFVVRERKVKVKVTALRECMVNKVRVDLSGVSGFVETGQLYAFGKMLARLGELSAKKSHLPLNELIEELYMEIEKNGFSVISRRLSGNLALMRSLDFFAGVSRLRNLRVKRRRLQVGRAQ